MRFKVALLAVPCLLLGANPIPIAPRFTRVYPLKPEEGVFAYARISPDGKTLAYASEISDPDRPRAKLQTVTVVDLQTKKILFEEPGIDAYWSHDGKRMVFLSFKGRGSSVVMRHHETGRIVRDIAPVGLGDYFSWARRDNKDLILTINSNFYYLNGDQAVLPHSTVPACAGMGRGERPLISHDGQRATTFVRGTVVVRSLSDCSYRLDTGMEGAKADFSWDGRYIAFHAPKSKGSGYEIRVVDIQERTVRIVTNFSGSSLFPSWTRDGRLNFRYDGDEYQGFLMADGVLSAPAKPLPTTLSHVPEKRTWDGIFPETRKPAHNLNFVLVWGTWSAHSPYALSELQRARDYFRAQALDVGVLTATDPGSREADIQRMITQQGIQLPRIPLDPQRLTLTEAHNQIPTTLLFRDGELIDRRLGAQSFEQLRDWIEHER